MSETVSHFKTEESSEFFFGLFFAIVFLIISLYPLINSQEILIWSLVISIILCFSAFLTPKILSFPNKLWFNFGMFLGSIIAPIVMALVYFITVLPTGLIMRLFGKDLLKQKLNKNTKSYWIERTESPGPMKNQF